MSLLTPKKKPTLLANVSDQVCQSAPFVQTVQISVQKSTTTANPWTQMRQHNGLVGSQSAAMSFIKIGLRGGKSHSQQTAN